MKISVIGTGYVGLVSGTCFAETGVNVHCVDIDVEKINNLKKGILPIYEPGLKEVVAEARGRNLFFSTEIDEGIREAEMIFISVNTPTKDYGLGKGMAADLKYVELCARQIARVAQKSKIVVEKSTLPVRTAESIKTILEAESNGYQFKVLSNPEFLAEGTAVADLYAPDRILIGGDEDEQGKESGADSGSHRSTSWNN